MSLVLALRGPAHELPVLQTGLPVEGLISNGAPVVDTDTLRAISQVAPAVGVTYRIEVRESGQYTIDLRSYFFDSYLVLRDERRSILAEDDDGLLGAHARLVIDLHAGRHYDLTACALHGARGAYELSIDSGRPVELSASELQREELKDAERGIEVVGAALGELSPEFAAYLTQQALRLWSAGNAAAARPLLERVLEIREDVLGAEHPDVVASLSYLAMMLQSQGDVAGARSLFERVLAVGESTLGPRHPELARSLNNLATLLQAEGRYDEARRLYERALDIREEALGRDDPAVAESLNNLALLLQAQGDYGAARPLLERAVEVAEATRGPDHPDVAICLSTLAVLLQAQGDFAGARPLYERALSIFEAELGFEHPYVAKSLNNLAALLEAEGDYAAARVRHERALAIQQDVLGPESADVATSLNNLAASLAAEGDYAAARSMCERALSIREAAFGPEHPEVATTLNNLATLLKQQGEYGAARPLIERALEIREAVFGAQHPHVANSLNDLALLVHRQGDHAGARPLYERALAIREIVHGLEHPDVAASLNNLAALLKADGDLDGARAMYERALAIRETSQGPDHPDVATILNNLAGVLLERGDSVGARSLYERALEIRETALGPEHPHVADSLNDLAMLLRREGSIARARPMLERALWIRQEVYGREHPAVARSLNNLAAVLVDLGDPSDAWERARRSAVSRRSHLERTIATLTEGESLLFVAELRWQLELLLSLGQLLDERGAATDAYETLLAWKGQVSRLMVAGRDRLFAARGPEEAALVDELRAVQGRLSRLALGRSRDKAGNETERQALRDERADLERRLRRLGAGATRGGSVSWKDLRSALPERSAVVDFFVHRTYEPARREGGAVVEPGRWAEPRLSAWITRSDRVEPAWLDLGLAAAIEHAVREHLRGLLGAGSVRGDLAFDEAPESPRSPELRALLWDRIAEELDGVETVFVSPDDVTGQVSFETLRSSDGRYLVQDYAFIYLGDARALVAREDAGGAYESVLTVGGVDYDGRRPLAVGASGTNGRDHLVSSEPTPVASSLQDSLREHWSALRATRSESAAVSRLHREMSGRDGRRLELHGADATEERLKEELPRYSVLHLATHGFFRPEGLPSMWESALDAATGEQRLRMTEGGERLAGMHPGLLSGLVCAGVNRAAGARADSSGGAVGNTKDSDDGYFTAEEVSWLDLTGVELVVLSACETGLGRPESGEGLLGLRRAFSMAGAKTVVSSLWQVGDESTAELMDSFYRNLWEKGMGRHEALRSAQLEMLAENRRRYGQENPWSWGAFVLSGEWR